MLVMADEPRNARSEMSETALYKKQLNDLRARQRPLIAVVSGIGAMAAGTALWILIAQRYQISGLSLAVAFGIASAIKYSGKTVDFRYGIAGGILSLIAAIAGNLATTIFILSKRGKTPMEILLQLDPATALSLLKALSGPMGVLFYIATVGIGFWFAFRHIPKPPPEIE